MKKLIIIFALLIISSGVFANISINQPSSIYNLGDKLYISLTGIKGAGSGNLNINLVCSNESINLVKLPARAFSTTEEQSYSIPYEVLDQTDLGINNLTKILGTCQVVASLGASTIATKSFKITKNIDVQSSIDKSSYNPGENVILKIQATKANGAMLNGIVEGTNATSFKKIIKDGRAEIVFTIPKTAESGIYRLNLHIYDKNNKKILNEKHTKLSYVVNSVATSLVLSLSNSVATPGEKYTIGAEVFDQAGVKMNGTILIKIISPQKKITDKTIQTGSFSSMNFPTNASAGTWQITAQFNKLTQDREFKMKPLQKASFQFEGPVLVIKNIGNTPYNKTININIGQKNKLLDLNIAVGETRKFSLTAPNGKYNVVVGDGDSKVMRQILLTGNTVSINDFKSAGILRNYSLIWIFLIILLGGLGITLFARYRKTRTINGKERWTKKLISKLKGNKNNLQQIDNPKTKNKEAKPQSSIFPRSNTTTPSLHKLSTNQTHKIPTSAESALVLKGEKYPSSVIAMNIKNYNELKESSIEELNNILEKTKGKGVIDHRGDYVFILFVPLITRTYRNEILAVKTGMRILESMKQYNKKFENKIQFGIGIHAGDLVANRNKGKLKYTGIGNTISFTRRMADTDSERVIISETIRKKLIRDLSVSKSKEISATSTYIVKKINDHSSDTEKLKELIKRRDKSL